MKRIDKPDTISEKRELIHNGATRLRSDVIIRASYKHRKVIGHGEDEVLAKGRVQDLLNTQKPCLCYTREVRTERRTHLMIEDEVIRKRRFLKWVKQRKGRNALLEVRYLTCRFDEQALLSTNTGHLSKEQLQTMFTDTQLGNHPFTYIQVREVDIMGKPIVKHKESPEAPIDWLLLTSCEINNSDDVLRVIDIYRNRFPIIEQYFRCLKKDGFEVEKAQQKSLKALQIVIAMAAKASVLVMKMIDARDQDEGFAIEDDFSASQIEVLQLCLTRYQGKTTAQTNHHPTSQLSWAVWIIARIGGWKPENKKRPPGPKTLQRGLDIFTNIYQGGAIAKGWQIDVSQP